jgi:vacuolar-type H+-ATPase subunit H
VYEQSFIDSQVKYKIEKREKIINEANSEAEAIQAWIAQQDNQLHGNYWSRFQHH